MKKLEKKLSLNRLTVLDLGDLTRIDGEAGVNSRTCVTACSPPVKDFTTCFGG